MSTDAYRPLAAALDALPHGYPPAEDSSELAILAHLFTPEEAALAAQLSATPVTVEALAAQTGGSPAEMRKLLKGMARRGLIRAVKGDGGLAYGLLPFVVGFFENQGPTIDAELAALVERYFGTGFHRALAVEPQFHRVIPVEQAVPVDIEVQPYESAANIINGAQAWAVIDCICRKQKALIGQACGHPIEVCLSFSQTPHAFDGWSYAHVLTREQALDVLHTAAEAGLVHTVSNHQADVGYICNCCTCACGILRAVKDLGMANAVARSAFVCAVDSALCISCEDCITRCPFDALALGEDGIMSVDRRRCVGCGQCVMHCEQSALHLDRRPEDEIKPVPASLAAWMDERAAARGV